MSHTGKDDRRKPEGIRARELVESLLERVGELEQQRAGDRTELLELAALLGRLEAAIDLEQRTTIHGTTYEPRQSAGGYPGECVHCGTHKDAHTAPEGMAWRPDCVLACPGGAIVTPIERPHNGERFAAAVWAQIDAQVHEDALAEDATRSSA